ncbi:hypothetical protein ACH4U8_45710, partial [Embleya sp. NPDC020886]
NETPDEVPSDKTAGQIIGRISGVDDGIPSSTTEKRRRQAADLPPGGPKKLVGKKPVEEKKKTPQGAARSASYVGSARDAQAPAARPAALAAGGGTRLDRSRVRAEVLALLPESVRKRLPQRTPLPLADVIAEQAQHRTVAELGDRVRRRWDRRGYATQTIESPVGVAVALLRSPACPDDRCEDGRVIGTGDMIHTGDPCVSCQQHKANRAAAKRAGETPPVRTLTRSVSAPPPAECVSCQKPWKAGSTVPEDGVCADCRRESAAADAEIAALMQATVDKWEREAAERQAAEDAERAEAERRRLEAEAAEEAAAAEARRVAAEDAERRARIAEKFPELVTPKQSTTAPF